MEDLKEEPVQARKRRRQTLHPVLMNRLKAFALSLVIASLLSHLANQCLHQEHDLDAIEFFAGRASSQILFGLVVSKWLHTRSIWTALSTVGRETS